MERITQLIHSKDIVKKLRNDMQYDRYMSESTPFAKGGSSETFLYRGYVVKRQKLDCQHLDMMSDDIFIRSGRCLLIKESFFLEAIVMSSLSRLSVLIPKLIDVMIARFQGAWYSLIVMQRQKGKPYLATIKGMRRRDKYTMWYHFLEDMKMLFDCTRFIHGDLITNNMLVDKGRIRLLDFGLSCIVVETLFCLRYHVAHRIARLSPTPALVLERIRSIDVCKLLYRETSFSPSFQKKLDTCQGLVCRRSLATNEFPNPVYLHAPKLTHAVALDELQTMIEKEDEEKN
jgi:hypothetical protein